MRRRTVLLGLGTAVGMLLVSGPAFADSCNFVVTNLGLHSVVNNSGSTTLDVAITVQDTGQKSGQWVFPNPTDPNISPNPQALPELSIVDENTGQSYTETANTLVTNPQPLSESNQSATAVYAFKVPLAAPGDQYNVQLVNHTSDHVFHMYQIVNGQIQYNDTSPVCNNPQVPPIVGQLPEVPFAAGLPLVGALAAGIVWYRKKRPVGANPG